MATTKPVYKNQKAGQPLLSVICSGIKTPVLEVKFSTLVKPFYYQNSPSIPRYSITCVVDPKEHAEFLKNIQGIEKNEKVESIIKNDSVKEGDEHLNTGKFLMKFQSKEKIPVYVGGRNIDEKQEQIELEDELARGERIMVVFDILRYTKKNTVNTEHGLSFRPSCVYYFAE